MNKIIARLKKENYNYKGIDDGMLIFVKQMYEYEITIFVDTEGEFDVSFIVEPNGGGDFFPCGITKLEQVKKLMEATQEADKTEKMVRQML